MSRRDGALDALLDSIFGPRESELPPEPQDHGARFRPATVTIDLDAPLEDLVEQLNDFETLVEEVERSCPDE